MQTFVKMRRLASVIRVLRVLGGRPSAGGKPPCAQPLRPTQSSNLSGTDI